MDIDREAIQYAQENSTHPKSFFLVGDALCVPFPDDYFDLVITAQNYEHVSDAFRLSEEIFRVLKPGGFCLFSGPNRLALIEDHYKLPFLSWLPWRLANLYVRWMGKGPKYEERPFTLWGLRRLWKRFVIHDYTVKMIRSPEVYGIDDEMQFAQVEICAGGCPAIIFVSGTELQLGFSQTHNIARISHLIKTDLAYH